MESLNLPIAQSPNLQSPISDNSFQVQQPPIPLLCLRPCRPARCPAAHARRDRRAGRRSALLWRRRRCPAPIVGDDLDRSPQSRRKPSRASAAISTGLCAPPPAIHDLRHRPRRKAGVGIGDGGGGQRGDRGDAKSASTSLAPAALCCGMHAPAPGSRCTVRARSSWAVAGVVRIVQPACHQRFVHLSLGGQRCRRRRRPGRRRWQTPPPSRSARCPARCRRPAARVQPCGGRKVTLPMPPMFCAARQPPVTPLSQAADAAAASR